MGQIGQMDPRYLDQRYVLRTSHDSRPTREGGEHDESGEVAGVPPTRGGKRGIEPVESLSRMEASLALWRAAYWLGWQLLELGRLELRELDGGKTKETDLGRD